MCGIFAVLGKYKIDQLTTILFNVLKNLENRGECATGIYASSGNQALLYERVANKDPGILKENVKERVTKQGLNAPERSSELLLGLAHNRWATNGVNSIENAHPHLSDESGTFVLIHNGIVENSDELKRELMSKGHTFYGETDSEVMAKLCLDLYNDQQQKKSDHQMNGSDHQHKENDHQLNNDQPNSNNHRTITGIDFYKIGRMLRNKIKGKNSVVLASTLFPNEILGIKTGDKSLILGLIGDKAVTDSNEMLWDPLSRAYRCKKPKFSNFALYSEPNALMGYESYDLQISKNQIVRITEEEAFVYEEKDENAPVMAFSKFKKDSVPVLTDGNKFFMIQEIKEQSRVVERLNSLYVDFENDLVKSEIDSSLSERLLRANRYVFIACGSSYYAALSARPYFEELTGVWCFVIQASLFITGKYLIFEDDVIIFISQSGETEDVKTALEICKSNRVVKGRAKGMKGKVNDVKVEGKVNDVKVEGKVNDVKVEGGANSGMGKGVKVEGKVEGKVNPDTAKGSLSITHSTPPSNNTASLSDRDVFCVAVVNTAGSYLGRKCEACYGVHAGYEKSIASTKTFTAQYARLLQMALEISSRKAGREGGKVNDKEGKNGEEGKDAKEGKNDKEGKVMDKDKNGNSSPVSQVTSQSISPSPVSNDCYRTVLHSLKNLPELIEETLKIDIEPLVQYIMANQQEHLIMMGSATEYPFVMEGGLKLVEISRILVKDIISLELKHGTLALMSPKMSVLLVAPRNSTYSDSYSAYKIVCSSGLIPFVVTTEGNEDEFEKCIRIPKGEDSVQGLMLVVLFQRVSYEIALRRGYNPDKPHLLAKSVTV